MIRSLDGQEHQCHRNLLSAASTPLRALLSGSFNEGNRNLDDVGDMFYSFSGLTLLFADIQIDI